MTKPLDFRALPKTELHLHIEGAITPTTILELIEKYDGPVHMPSVSNLSTRFTYDDFEGFLSAWRWMTGYVREYEDFTRIACGVARRLAEQGVRYAELSFSPPDFLHHNLKLQLIAIAVRKGLDLAGVPVRIQLILDLCRQYGPLLGARWLEETAEVAKEVGIIGIGLGGPEHLAPPEPYAAVYRRAAELGLRRVAHAGEAASAKSIWDTIRSLGVERIGHGTRALEDPALVVYLRNKRIPLEVCLTSNVRTRVVQRIEEHPVRKFFDAGMKITLSSDDPTFFQTDIVAEYELLRDVFQFSDEEIIDVARVGFEVAFIDDETRNTLLAEFNAGALKNSW